MLESTTVTLDLKVLQVGTTWKADKPQKVAAWEMYVELCTRITTAELKEDEGSLREALSSMYLFFGITREILKKHGPKQMKKLRGSDTSFGFIALFVLNKILRPTLSKWHPELAHWESQKPEGESANEHERKWEKNGDLRRELNEVRGKLIVYADTLGKANKIPSGFGMFER